MIYLLLKFKKKIFDDIFLPSLFINTSIYIYFAYKKGNKMLKIKIKILKIIYRFIFKFLKIIHIILLNSHECFSSNNDRNFNLAMWKAFGLFLHCSTYICRNKYVEQMYIFCNNKIYYYLAYKWSIFNTENARK